MSIAMSKHMRTSSWDQQGYRTDLPVTMGPSVSMYNPRLGLPPSSYYPEMNPGPSSLGSDPSSGHHGDYSVYESSAPAVIHPHQASLPPNQRPSSGAWNQEDDAILRKARASGYNWSQIQTQHFQNKTPNACRKRHERIMERRGHDEFDDRKLENMCKEYMAIRKEIWQPLAAVSGEKWNIVESWMLSSGIKNIQSHARAATRRERLASGQPLPPNVDNDGLDMDGLPVNDMDADYNSPDMGPGHNNNNNNGDVSGPGPSSSAYASSHLQLPPYYSHGHAYTSSISSDGTTTTNYSLDHSRSNSASHDNSPYSHGHQRLPSVDMVDAIINRPIVGSSGAL